MGMNRVLPAVTKRRNLAEGDGGEWLSIRVDKEGAGDGPLVFEADGRSERWIVRPRFEGNGQRGSSLFLEEIKDIRLVVGSDFVAEVVQQFDDGEGLPGCPVGVDEELDAGAQPGGLVVRFHAAPPFLRGRTRFAARSWASLKR